MKDIAKTGWTTKPLGEVVEVIGGGTPSKRNAAFYGGEIPWATVRDMNVEHISRTEHSITPAALKASSSKLIPAGEVVIATRVGLGKVCILAQDTAINQDLRGLVPKSSRQVDRRFLFHWYKSIAGQVIAAGTGATVQGVKLPFLKGLPLPLPPLEEQQRIVAVLDEAFEGLARARANAEANLQNARELFSGTIASEFAKIETVPKRKVGEVAVHSLGKMLDKKKNKGTLRPYLRNLNVRWFNVDTSDLLEMRITDAEMERYTVRKGDLLICEGGYPGRSSIWEDDDEIFFQKALHRVRFEDEAYSRLLMYFLYMSDQSGALKDHFSGSGIQHFTGQALAKFEMPYPSVSKATEMIGAIEAMQRNSVELERHFQKKNEELADLQQSLLQKAFAGELT